MIQSAQATELVLGVPRASNRIEAADATELRWYFSDPPIAGVFTESSFGAQLERAELFGLGGRPCTKCGGDRQRGTLGTGFAPKSGKGYRGELQRYRRREAQRLGLRMVPFDAVQGWRDLGIKAASPEEIAAWLPDNLVRECPACHLVGWVQGRPRRGGPQTARPTGSSIQVGAREPSGSVNETALARYGRLSRLLEAVRHRSELARGALEVYYGPGGGSVTCLWALTDPGREYALSLPNPFHVSARQLLDNERSAQTESPSTERAKRLGPVARAASNLWDHASETWNLVVAA
jgi:hypothetical protein